jgi:Uma2 family endonuclease
MSTITAPAPPTAPPAEAERRFMLPGVSWETYEKLRDEYGSRHVRMTYDRGRLELMSPSLPHEERSFWFESFIMEVARGLGLRCKPVRSTTWKKPDEVGKEADACFYLANEHRIRGKKEIDLTIDPPPDLAIEVEISPPDSDIESVYAALGVPEIWRYKGHSLRVLERQPDGTYAERDRSPSLPYLPLDEVVRLIREAESLNDDPRWLDQVAQWVRDVLGPLYRQHPRL